MFDSAVLYLLVVYQLHSSLVFMWLDVFMTGSMCVCVCVSSSQFYSSCFFPTVYGRTRKTDNTVLEELHKSESGKKQEDVRIQIIFFSRLYTVEEEWKTRYLQNKRKQRDN